MKDGGKLFNTHDGGLEKRQIEKVFLYPAYFVCWFEKDASLVLGNNLLFLIITIRRKTPLKIFNIHKVTYFIHLREIKKIVDRKILCKIKT